MMPLLRWIVPVVYVALLLGLVVLGIWLEHVAARRGGRYVRWSELGFRLKHHKWPWDMK